MLITGGFGPAVTNSVEIYDPATELFTAAGGLLTARADHTATLLSTGIVLISGGWTGSSATNRTELYDPGTRVSHGAPNLTAIRYGHTATPLASDQILIAGGSDGSGVSIASAELYTLATGAFTAAGNMTVPRSNHTATLLANGNVLIAAGSNNVATQGGLQINFLTSAEIYHPTTSTPSGLVSISLAPVNPQVSTGAVQRFTATGTFSDSSTRTLVGVNWTSSNTGVAAITNDISNYSNATALAVGSTTITASAGSVSGSTVMTVAAPTLVSIAVTPANPSVTAGATQQFTATGTYTDNSTQNLTSSVTWSSSATATATINSAGLATGVAAGSATITATSGAVNGSTTLTVTGPTLVSIAVTPANSKLFLGNTQKFTATGAYSNNSTQDITGSVTWSSSDTTLATISAAGLVTPVAKGTVTITATSGAVSGNTSLTIASYVLVSEAAAEVVTSPRSTAAPSRLLFPYVFTQSGFDTEITISNTSQDPLGTASQNGTCNLNFYGNAASITQTASIAAGKQLIFSVMQGGSGMAAYPNFSGYLIATCDFPLARGSARIYGGIIAYSQDAQPITLPRSTATPTALLLPFVNTQSGFDTFIAITNTSKDPYGTTAGSGACSLNFYGVNAPANPASTGTIAPGGAYFNLASFLAPNFQGYAIATCNFADAAGAVFVSDSGARNIMLPSTPELLTVPRDPTLRPLLFSAVNSQNGLDTTLAIANTSKDPFGTSITSGACTLNFFGTNAPAAVTTPTINAGSVYTTLASAIAPNFQGYVTASCPFTMARGWMYTIPAGNHGEGDGLIPEVVSQPRSVTPAALMFSSVSNINGADTRISILNTSQDPFGTASAAGSCVISYFGDVSGGNVPAAQTSTSIQPGDQLSFTLSQGNAAQGIAGAPGFRGYVIANCGFPLARGVATIFSQAGVTVPQLQAIAVTPASPSIVAGTTQQFTATGTYTDSSTRDLTRTTVWSSNTPATATINSAGLATGVAAGSTTIKATSASSNGTTVLTVTAPTLVSIAVTPANPTISISQTQQFTATGTYSNNTTQNLTGSVTWTSSATGVATINSSGLASPVAGGSTTITATLGAVSGSTGLTVNAPTIVSIALSPQSPTLRIGSILQFSAIATLSDNSTLDVTSTATWSSSQPTFISVSSTGLATALTQAFATITVSQGSAGASTQVQGIPPFTATGSMGAARRGPMATLLNNGKVLITGGSNSSILATATLYDPAAGTFTATGSMTTARGVHTATLLNNGKVLIAGGSNGSADLSTAELYDPATGTFTATGSMVTGARGAHTATLLNNGKVLIAGGVFVSGITSTPLTTAELYDPATGTFTATGSLIAARYGATATLLNSGKVLVAGGFNASADLSSAELFDPAAGTFSSAGSMKAARSSYTATLLNGGNVLLAGGSSGSAYTASAEVYDPVAGTFTFTGSMSEARGAHAASLLNSGKVLITGGRFTNTANVYDPATGQFAGGIAMSVNRENHTSTLLTDGRVLLAGGDNPTPLSSAELYITNALTPAGLLSISVTPANLSISAPAALHYQATGTFTGNVQQTLASATWSSSNTGIAAIANDAGSAGWANATGTLGTTTITAAAGSVSGSTSLTMTAPVLVSIAVTPANPSISTAQTQQFTATGTYSNNTTQNLTGSVSWTSSATGVATINSSGLASAVATGSTTITATSGAISGATGLTVNAPTIVSIFVVPANTTIRVGSTQQFAAIALLSDNSTQDVTASVNWSSSLPSYIPISSTGLVTALNAAFTTISASKDSFSASTQAQAISPFTGGGSISMPSTRKSHTATVLNNGQVLIAGGFNSLALATAALYNSNGTFTATGGSMITARVFHTATLLNNGKVLIAGGFNGSTYLSGAELFDPATGTFTATGSLVTGARAHHTATLLNNGKVLIAGGLFSNGATTTPLASAELYDPADGTFTATGSLAATRYTATATLLNNGKVLVAGGFNASVDLNSAELFDPAAGSFTSAGSSMTAARSSHTATLLNGGKVLLAGGSSGSTFTASAEVYDPVAGTFTATTGNLSEARVSHAASLLNSGKVLLTGGRFTDTADVYDPATGLFAGGIAMSVKRENHTSTLLPNGQVLLAGGDNPTVLSSAELYITNVLTPSGLLSISVAPASQTISAWGSTRYQATGTFSGNAQQTLASATWSSSNPSVATIANDSGSAGWAAGTGLIGTTLITATAGSVSSSTGLTTQPTDLVADFQSSPFSYGWTASQGGAFNVYTVQDTTTFPGATELLRSGPAGTPPYVAKNTTCCDLNIGQQFTMPPNQLHMHPGPNGEYTVVRFTVPAGGTYTLAGQFGWLDNATTDVHILRNNVSIFDGAINGSGSTAPFNQSVALNAGDRLDFIVGFGSNGTYFSDSTVLKGTISKLN